MHNIQVANLKVDEFWTKKEFASPVQSDWLQESRWYSDATEKSSLKSKSTLGSTGKDMINDDNFYSNIAAEIEEESDVSEADVSKMLADMNDMDDALFGSSLKSRPSSKATRQPSVKNNRPAVTVKDKSGQKQILDKTLEDELAKALHTSNQPDLAESPSRSPSRSSKPKAQPKKFDFGEFDEDDPLAGLLSDDENSGSKKPVRTKTPQGTKTDQQKPELKPETDPSSAVDKPASSDHEVVKTQGLAGKDKLVTLEASPSKRPASKKIDFNDDDDDSDLMGSLVLEKNTKDQSVKLEALPSEKPTSKKIDFDDDDDDVLGSLGLEKNAKNETDLETRPRTSSPRGRGRSRGKSDPDADFGDESDLLGSLGLGTSPREKRRAKPEDSSEVEQARTKVSELFGTSGGSKMFDKPPAGKQRQSQLDRILQKKDKNIAKEDKEEDFSFGDYTPSSTLARPESAPPSRRSVRFSDDDFSKTSSLSRPRSRARMAATIDEPIERPHSAAAGITSSKMTSRKSRVSTEPSDWLELAAGSTDGNKLDDKAITDEAENKKLSSGKEPTVDPRQSKLPLGTSDFAAKDEKSSPVTSKQEEIPSRAPSAADYLGLSDTDIDLDSLLPSRAPTPKDVTLLNYTLDDPFNEPVSPFPWDTSRSRQTPPTSTPQPVGKPHHSQSIRTNQRDEFDMDEEDDDNEHKDTTQSGLKGTQLQQQLQEKQQQQAQTVPDRPPTPLQRRRQTSPEMSLQKPTSRGYRKEPQWRQQLKQKQQQQRDGDKQHDGSVRTGSSMSSYEQQLAFQSSDTTPQMYNPLASATLPSSLPGYTATSQQQQQQTMITADAPWKEHLERSQKEMDEALRRQQAQWASQQQSLQQQLQEQQQQAMQQQLQMQKALLDAQMTSPMSTLQQSMPGPNPLIMPGLQSYGRNGTHFETEKRRLETELQSLQQAHSQQMTALQNAHKDYIELLEESAGRRESRLRQEHSVALQQYEQRLKQLQEDHEAQQEQQQQRVQQLTAEHQAQLQQLQQTHRFAMDAMQQQHEQQLQQVKHAMQRELEAINGAQTHSKSLQAVMNKVQSASQELGSLQNHIHGQHQSQLDQRTQELREKDQQLQALDKRLSDKQDEMMEERTRLESLVSRLEAHIRQQNTQLDEEKFRLRQEQSKLTSLQRATEEERKLAAEHLASQQASLQKAKDALLNEQQTIMGQCLDERKALAAERAQVSATRRQLEASLQEQASKALQVGAEQEGKLESLASERSQLTAQAASLHQQKQQLQQEQLQLSQHRQELDGEQRRLQQLAETLRQRSQQIQDAVSEGVQAREEGQSALQTARKIEAEQATRETNVQTQLQTLRTTQRQIAQERLDLAREQRNIERLQGSLRCQMCRGTVPSLRTIGTSSPTRIPQDTLLSPQPKTDILYPERETAPSRTLTLQDVDTLLSQAELGHSLRMWKMAADKDKDFLEEESIFLETLKSSLPVGSI